MSISHPSLFVEVNNFNFIFFVGEYDQNENFKIIYESNISLNGINGNKISDFEKILNEIKEKIFSIEKKFNHTFREIVLILDKCELTFVSLTGYKNLNGSQVVRENITYILNSLKSYVDEIEVKKTILHIFNSKFNLDNKKIDNLPIGLFGDFYSHELSFILMDKNNFKNLKTIFEKCNLKVKKFLSKSFIQGAHISNNYKNNETFFQIKINTESSKIIYFENNALKFEQDFKFGNNIIIKDISKITSLKDDDIITILNKNKYSEISDDELVEEVFFKNINYRKIKKKLIYEIALARIKEISEIIIFNNINFEHYNKFANTIFLEMSGKQRLKGLDEIFKSVFSMNESFEFNFIENPSSNSLINTANILVHFGWKKEAIPVSELKKSFLARFFSNLFE
jgi:cell division protein FtsA